MKKRNKDILWGFALASILSFMITGNPFFPLAMVLLLIGSGLLGIPIALDLISDATTYQWIIITLSISLLMMFYGFVKQKTSFGKTIFILGFIVWSGIGLVYGLGKIF